MKKVTERQAHIISMKLLCLIGAKYNMTPERVVEFFGAPTIMMDWNGGTAIGWESGPDEWALEYSMDLTDAFKGKFFCEPYYSCVLSIYREA